MSSDKDHMSVMSRYFSSISLISLFRCYFVSLLLLSGSSREVKGYFLDTVIAPDSSGDENVHERMMSSCSKRK